MLLVSLRTSSIDQRPGLDHPSFESAPRSPKWPALRDRYFKSNPECAACGSGEDCQIHHVKSFLYFPESELDPGNLITLCRHHHLLIGHGDNFKAWNPGVRDDAAEVRRVVDRAKRNRQMER